jgi:hypothetical protein
MAEPARKHSPAWCGPAVAPVSKRVTGAAAATTTATAGGGVILLPPPPPAPHDADACPDCGAGLCAELASYDPGTGETLWEARDYCAACGLVPAIRPAAAVGVQAVDAPAAAPREYDFSPPHLSGGDVGF